MQLRILLIVALLTLVLPVGSGRAQELDELTERVRSYSKLYLESLRNMGCAVEGSVAQRPFHGEIALLNGVTPFHFPSNGGFCSSSVTISGSGHEEAEKTSINLGNPQYSSRLARQEPGTSLQLDDLSIQYDNVDRKDILKDPVFFAFSATDSAAVFAPIMVFDISTIDLLNEGRGVQSRIAPSSSSKQTDVEFIFPENHPFGHASAQVSFGECGEVLHYELRERAQDGIEVSYTYDVRYSESERTASGLALPNELRIQTKTKSSGKTRQLPDNWYKLSNFEFGKIRMDQFTLSHYGIPEPEGATVLGRPLPSQKQTMPPQFELPELTLRDFPIGEKADLALEVHRSTQPKFVPD